MYINKVNMSNNEHKEIIESWISSGSTDLIKAKRRIAFNNVLQAHRAQRQAMGLIGPEAIDDQGIGPSDELDAHRVIQDLQAQEHLDEEESKRVLETPRRRLLPRRSRFGPSRMGGSRLPRDPTAPRSVERPTAGSLFGKPESGNVGGAFAGAGAGTIPLSGIDEKGDPRPALTENEVKDQSGLDMKHDGDDDVEEHEINELKRDISRPIGNTGSDPTGDDLGEHALLEAGESSGGRIHEGVEVKTGSDLIRTAIEQSNADYSEILQAEPLASVLFTEGKDDGGGGGGPGGGGGGGGGGGDNSTPSLVPHNRRTSRWSGQRIRRSSKFPLTQAFDPSVAPPSLASIRKGKDKIVDPTGTRKVNRVNVVRESRRSFIRSVNDLIPV